MGTYVYKTTAKEVQLENGELANVAVFAYKPSFWDDFSSIDNRAAAQTHKRHEWVVLGYKNDETGKVEVELGSTAVKMGQRGTFDDHLFDSDRFETSTVIAPVGAVALVDRVCVDTGEDAQGYSVIEESVYYLTGKKMKRVLVDNQTYRTMSYDDIADVA